MLYFKKYQDTMLEIKMKDKYDLSRDTRGFLINFITNHIVWFTAKVLDTKLLKKMRSNQCTVGAIAVLELYVEGVQINWLHYLLNELLADAKELQQNGTTFH